MHKKCRETFSLQRCINENRYEKEATENVNFVDLIKFILSKKHDEKNLNF